MWLWWFSHAFSTVADKLCLFKSLNLLRGVSCSLTLGSPGVRLQVSKRLPIGHVAASQSISPLRAEGCIAYGEPGVKKIFIESIRLRCSALYSNGLCGLDKGGELFWGLSRLWGYPRLLRLLLSLSLEPGVYQKLYTV